MVDEIDNIVRLSLLSLAEDIYSLNWSGRREREVVSLFCFGHLLTHCRSNSFLHNPTQIGIEIAVPQIKEQTNLSGKAESKNQVCKDIVIWSKPKMTCWDSQGKPNLRPTCIIEWKHNESRDSQYDIDWLSKFSGEDKDFIGYSVKTNNKIPMKFRLSCTRIYKGIAEPKWIYID